VSSIDVGGYIRDVKAVRDRVWVLTCVRKCGSLREDQEQIVEVDALSGAVVRRLAQTNASAIAVAHGQVWVAHFFSGVITRVNPQTARVTRRVDLNLPAPVAAHDLHFLPYEMSSSAGYVWVATSRGWIAKISARTGALVRMLRTPSEQNNSTTDRYGTWVAENLDGIGLLRPRGERLQLRTILQHGYPLSIDDVMSSGPVVWALGTLFTVDGAPHTVVVMLNPRTDRVVRQLTLPEGEDATVSGGALYLGDLSRSRHSRIYRVSRLGRVSWFRAPRRVATLLTASPGFLWAATTNGALPHARPGRLLRIKLPGA
jgi:hypothetical protein